MYRALVSFSGLISMAEGEIREIADKAMVKDLLNAGYIEEISPDSKPKEVTPESAEKPKKKSAGKKKKKSSDK